MVKEVMNLCVCVYCFVFCVFVLVIHCKTSPPALSEGEGAGAFEWDTLCFLFRVVYYICLSLLKFNFHFFIEPAESFQLNFIGVAPFRFGFSWHLSSMRINGELMND